MKDDEWAGTCLGIIIVILLMIGMVYGLNSLLRTRAEMDCTTLAATSKYTVKFDGSVLGPDHCWLELAPGVWADSRWVKFDSQ